MAGALTVEATEPVTAHTQAAAITTTATDSTSQPWGRAKRTGRSSSSGDWSLARACWRNCTELSLTWKRERTGRLRPAGLLQAGSRQAKAPEPKSGSGTRRSQRVRSETGDQVGDRSGAQAGDTLDGADSGVDQAGNRGNAVQRTGEGVDRVHGQAAGDVVELGVGDLDGLNAGGGVHDGTSLRMDISQGGSGPPLGDRATAATASAGRPLPGTLR